MIVKLGLRPIDPITGLGHADGAPGMAVCAIDDRKNEDGNHAVSYVVGSNGREIRDHLFVHPGLTSHLPGNDAVLEVHHTVRQHIAEGTNPEWVEVEAQDRDQEEAADFQRCLSELYNCSQGEPEDVEDTHYTLRGATVYPPGQRPGE